MWEVRVSHPGLHKFRVIKAQNKSDLDRKAAEQIAAWDVQWANVQLARARQAARDAQAYTKEQGRLMAEERTTEAERRMAALDALLQDAVGKDHRVKWSALKDHSPYQVPTPEKPAPLPAPPEPRRESFPDGLNSFTRAIPSIRKKRTAMAEQAFRSAKSAWQAACADVERKNRETAAQYERDLQAWNSSRSDWLRHQQKGNDALDATQAAYMRCDRDAVVDYCERVLHGSPYPDGFPSSFDSDYVPETRTLVVDYALPPISALPTAKAFKYVLARNQIQLVPVSESWCDKTYDSVLYQIALRTLYETFQSDEASAFDSVVFNGWVNSIDKATGKEVNACVLSVQATKPEFLGINLSQVDPKACFKKLKGISAARLTELSPIRPILQLNKEDKRFIPSREVVEGLDSSANLAAMDWEDFEHLIREVFEMEFSAGGGEVKITQASRDGGVDAVVFDPDPIRGGKIIVQAKRYTNTVGVSAVRDLFGTIINEGANKGILVTTADYGPDAYEFAKDKPITLLSGNELLYLLGKHGHKARIDLPEARMLAAEKERHQQGNGRSH